MIDIKFRAYDHVDCVMLFADIYEMQDIQGEWTAWDLPPDSPTNTGTPFDIMQFTGLTDKNGVDIYEGDIVTYKDSFFVGAVYFKAGEYHIKTDISNHHLVTYTGKYLEVIGNIHQNKELLND